MNKELIDAWDALVTFVPESFPLTAKTFRENERYMGSIPEGAPFASEASLYTILGKSDARTFRALLRQVALAAGLKEERTYNL